MPVTLRLLDAAALVTWGVLPAAVLVAARRRLRAAGSRAVGPAALAGALAGIAVLTLPVVPSLADELERSFAGHMAQHLLLGLVGPLLLVLGRTAELAPWALPTEERRRLHRRVGALLHRPRSLRAPTVAMVAIWYAWHVPALYDAAVAVPPLHVVEHLSYLVAGWWFWLAVAPQRRRGRAPAVPALFAVTLAVGLLGAVLSLSPVAFYDEVAATTTQARLDDQHLGGLLMWTPGGFIYLVAAVLVLVRWVAGEDRLDRARVAPELGAPP